VFLDDPGRRARDERLTHESNNQAVAAMNASAPIGIFDSGVGGLSVVRALRGQMPAENVVFLADQAHVPYGARTLAEIQRLSVGITKFLLAQGAKLIVVACNTASAAALADLRRRFQEVTFVGMEPALKPAVETTKSGRVGVLATPATFQGALYASIVERFAADVTLFQESCPGLVEQIERGELRTARTRSILEQALLPMLGQGIDTIVLGCTHYPFVVPLIQEIVGEQVRVIDPAPAVARQAGRVLEAKGLRNDATQARGAVQLYTSGSPAALGLLLPKLLGEAGEPRSAAWKADAVLAAEAQ
jgi:glutamate racemase